MYNDLVPNPRDGFYPLGEELRKLIKLGRVEEFKQTSKRQEHPNYPQCAYGCWLNSFDENSYNNPNCKGFLFREINQGMEISAAKILQKREQDREVFKKSLSRSTIAIVIAIISLFSSMLFSVYQINSPIDLNDDQLSRICGP